MELGSNRRFHAVIEGGKRMEKNICKNAICLTAIAVFLVISLSVGTAMAYFTTCAVAQGGYSIVLGGIEAEIEEEVELVDPRKEIKIKNTGNHESFVRLKVLTGNILKENMKYTEPGGEGKWVPGEDGYYYFSDVLQPDESTSQLNVSFVFPKEELEQFNVIIVQECTPVLYDADGIPHADWNNKADISQSVYK